jgi:hypothetical protein
LKALVVEASRALSCLDAGRLEELAASCRALNRDLANAGCAERVALACQARAAHGDMDLFARVLDVTRANLQVMRRLRAIHEDRLDYGEGAVAGAGGWMRTGTGNGDN